MEDRMIKFVFEIFSILGLGVSYSILYFATNFELEAVVFALPFLLSSLRDITVDRKELRPFQLAVAAGTMCASSCCVILSVVLYFTKCYTLATIMKVLLLMCIAKNFINAAYYYFCSSNK